MQGPEACFISFMVLLPLTTVDLISFPLSRKVVASSQRLPQRRGEELPPVFPVYPPFLTL